MLSVDVGIGHQDDLVIAQLGEIELVMDSCAERRDDRLHLGVLQDTVDAGLLDVDDLAAQRKYRLIHRVTPGFRATSCRVPLDDEKLTTFGVATATVGQFPRQPAETTCCFAAHQFPRSSSSGTCLCRRRCLGENSLGFCRVGVEPFGQLLVTDSLHE